MNIKKGEEVLTFGFTLGTLFDMKESEKVFNDNPKETRETLYRQYFAEMNKKGEVFKKGTALGLYIALHNLRKVLPNDILRIRFGISSRFDTNHEGLTTLLNSLDHYVMKNNEDLMPDYISLTGGLEQASSHKMQGADLVFTSSDSSAKDYHNSGIAAVHIPNLSEEQNEAMYDNRFNPINFIFDFDGVLADHKSEMVYQAAKKIGNLDPVEEFRVNELKNRDTPMNLGPLGAAARKLSRVVAYYQRQMLNNEIEAKDIPFKDHLLTARGGSATFRVMKTLTHYDIQLSRADFADGRPKHIALNMLNKSEINLFLEDSRVHVDGARDNVPHVIAGLVFNDYTAGNETLNEAVKNLENEKKKEKNEIQKRTILTV